MRSTTTPEISTHSMLLTFRRCPRQALYKYSDKLLPKEVSRPLKMGSWFHSLLEAHYKGESWQERHREILAAQTENFFEEELATVPEHILRLMRSYLWYYQLESKYGFKVIEAEKRYETQWPDGSTYQCMVDLLVEIKGELWIVDHKLRSQLPGHLQRLLDSQLIMYLWCLRRNGIPVVGIAWNYVRMKAPVVPRVLKNGTLSRRKIDTDYVTLRRVVRENEIDATMYEAELTRLRAVYWRPGKVQTSPFFVREFLRADEGAVRRIVLEMYRTRKRMTRYDFTANRDSVERVVGNDCSYRCSYNRLCSAELFGGNAEALIRSDFTTGDPLGYYSRTD